MTDKINDETESEFDESQDESQDEDQTVDDEGQDEDQSVDDVEELRAQLEHFQAELRKKNSEARNLRRRLKESSKDGKDDSSAIDPINHLRLKVAYEMGIPPELMPRLRGEDEEELREDAEELLKLFAPTKTKTAKVPPKKLRPTGGPSKDTFDPDDLAGRLFAKKRGNL